jgi:crotonobetainyl-CoA:carnitine CoA-transferase CaiB-like acyl-CoA transferase
MFLADMGADVIRVDPPGGPVWDTPANATWNRGKRSIVLDLKSESDRKIAQALIDSADVVVENFRPGVMERLGLGPDAMTSRNERLIYCSIPGFAKDDPRADIAAWEGVVGAATATYRPPPTSASPDRPVYTAIPIASTYAAFQAAVAIAMSLVARERSGRGQAIEVPMFDAMFPSIGIAGLRIHDPSKIAPVFRGLWAGTLLCKDGRWLRFTGQGNQNFGEFVRAAGIESWESEGLLDFERLLRDPQLRAEQMRRMRELFLTRTAQEWEDLIAAAGSEGTMCYTSAEWINHPHARESRMIVETEDYQLGPLLQPGLNVRMSLTPGKTGRPRPRPDQDREAVLADLARPKASSGGSRPENALRRALEGVRVLDLCIILAGPTLGRTLAEYGADVIKIDPPRRGAAVVYHNDINRGKRSILLDLKSEEGREIFWRLLEKADVVAENFRDGKLEKLGLGYEAVRKRKPDIIYASSNAYGYCGPWRDRPGHEQFAQSATGMDRRFGGDGPPAMQVNAVNDYGTGFMAAYGVALALLHRLRTGEGQRVDTSLAYTAVTLQSQFMQAYEGKVWDEPSGQEALGSSAFHRAYRVKDGWLFVGMSASQASSLPRIGGLAATAGLVGAELEAALERCIEKATVEEWMTRLRAAGIGAHPVLLSIDPLLSDQYVLSHGLSVTRVHDEIGPVTTCGPAVRLSQTPVAIGRPAPKPGSDAASILAEIGMESELEALVERGVIRTQGVMAG